MECRESATVCSFVSLMLFLLLLLKQVHLFSFFGELSISWLFVVLVKYCYITNYSKILTDLKDSNFIHLLQFCNLGRTRQERSTSGWERTNGMSWLRCFLGDLTHMANKLMRTLQYGLSWLIGWGLSSPPSLAAWQGLASHCMVVTGSSTILCGGWVPPDHKGEHIQVLKYRPEIGIAWLVFKIFLTFQFLILFY